MQSQGILRNQRRHEFTILGIYKMAGLDIPLILWYKYGYQDQCFYISKFHVQIFIYLI